MRDPRRRFTGRDRVSIYLDADGRCQGCGAPLESGWHADHVLPHSLGGATELANGQALCPACNLKKGARLIEFHDLRPWQREAIAALEARRATSVDFLAAVTPGAGKTIYGLAAARRALNSGEIKKLGVVVPRDALRDQWLEEAARTFNIQLMPIKRAEDFDKKGYDGHILSYQQLAATTGTRWAESAERVVRRSPTMVILDEIHHCGKNQSWGRGVTSAYSAAVQRLLLTGTPWRSDRLGPIPFATYRPDGFVKADFSYPYGAAVADGVCRRIEFHAYDGEARWVDCGTVRTESIASEDLSDDDIPAILDTILSPDRGWMPEVLRAAAEDLRELRQTVPDAGGLVIAERQAHAWKYAEILSAVTGEDAVVVVSDDPESTERLAKFKKGRQQWLVAVRMVSEGVDIKRLAVGVYAAKSRTPLFFQQVVGRFVRVRPSEDFNSKLFIPAVADFPVHAKAIEDQLRHQLDLEREQHEKAAALREREMDFGGQARIPLHEPLSAGDAALSESIFGGESLTPEEHAHAVATCRDYQIPSCYAPQIAAVLKSRQWGTSGPATTAWPPSAAEAAAVAEAVPRARREKMLKKEIDSLAGKVAYRAQIRKEDVNRAILDDGGFPLRARCGVDDLERILEWLGQWLAELR